MAVGFDFLMKMDRVRRKHIRYKIKNSCYVSCYIKDDISKSLKCDIINVSSNGVCVRANILYDVGQAVTLRVVNTSDLHEISGNIIWKSDNYYGVNLKQNILDIVEFDTKQKYLGI
jgi:hypothetical protein